MLNHVRHEEAADTDISDRPTAHKEENEHSSVVSKRLTTSHHRLPRWCEARPETPNAEVKYQEQRHNDRNDIQIYVESENLGGRCRCINNDGGCRRHESEGTHDEQYNREQDHRTGETDHEYGLLYGCPKLQVHEQPDNRGKLDGG